MVYFRVYKASLTDGAIHLEREGPATCTFTDPDCSNIVTRRRGKEIFSSASLYSCAWRAGQELGNSFEGAVKDRQTQISRYIASSGLQKCPQSQSGCASMGFSATPRANSVLDAWCRNANRRTIYALIADT